MEVGEIITFINNGNKCDYIVIRSEEGELVNDDSDLQSCVDGTLLISSDLGYENIRLITCTGIYYRDNRWVVIAEKIEWLQKAVFK